MTKSQELLKQLHSELGGGERAKQLLREYTEAVIEENNMDIIHKLRGMDQQGVAGCKWGDTDFDSRSVAYGYNNALDDVIDTIVKHTKLFEEETDG